MARPTGSIEDMTYFLSRIKISCVKGFWAIPMGSPFEKYYVCLKDVHSKIHLLMYFVIYS